MQKVTLKCSPTKTNDGSLNVVQAAQQDIGRNDAQRANTNGAINGMLGSMAFGAAAPLVAIVAMEAAPIMLTSYLANPVTWNSAGSSALLGSTGYGGETPNAGTLEGAAAREGTQLESKVFLVTKEGVVLPKGAKIP